MIHVPLPADYERIYDTLYPGELSQPAGTVVRWFGSPWPSSHSPNVVCRPDTHIDIPHGTRCVACRRVLTRTDRGLSLPGPAGRAYYDLHCWLNAIGA